MYLPLVALFAGPGWIVELDATESFDNVQPGAIHTYHYAHFTLELDVDGPPARDGHLRVASGAALAREIVGRVDGGREAPGEHGSYTATLATRRAALSVIYDSPRAWALEFALPLTTKGTTTACVSARACAEANSAPLAPLGWVLAPASGGTWTQAGDIWFFDYAQDDSEAAPGKTRRHRELHLVLRPR